MTRSHGHIPQAAILMIVGAVACFSVGDSIAKSLTSRYPIPLLVWARWGAQVLAMLIWLAPKMGTGMVRTRQLRMQLVRGVLLIASSLCFMSALRYMPLAHPDLIKDPGSVIVSYSRNNTDVKKVQDDPFLYRPQFLQVTLPGAR